MSDIEDQIDKLAEQDEIEFRILRPLLHADADRPLYLLIHPGDVVQKPEDVEHSSDPEGILDYSQLCQERLAGDLDGLEGWDIVVLHRISSSYAFANDQDIDYDFVDMIRANNADDAIGLCWGDDLDAAARHFIEELDAVKRPMVVVGGAWSHVGEGCVTIIGTRLEEAGATVRSSTGACISPDGSEDEWLPRGGRISRDDLHSFRVAPAMTA